MSHEIPHRTWLQARLDDYPYACFFAVLSGAHMYGFPSDDSDFDVRGVHILPIEEVVGLEHGTRTVERMEVVDGGEFDAVTHDIEKFVRLLLDKNAMALEQITSPYLIAADEEDFDKLRAIASECVTRHHIHHYRGYVRARWEAFEQGLRLKALLYAYRGCLTGIHLMRTGEVEANLGALGSIYSRPDLDELIETKREGAEKMQLDEAQVAVHRPRIEELKEELERAHEETDLPERIPTEVRERADELLVRVRLR
ncbi:MAG: DNA polymerase beta superfamily protein [Persicimonas sp.]